MEFINRFKSRSETLSYNDRAFFSGSSAEIPAADFFAKPTDLDFMLYRVDVCAILKDAQPPRDFKGEVLTIDPKGLSAGYVRLSKSTLERQSRDSEQDFQKQLQKFAYDIVNDPAITTDVGWSAFIFDRVFSVQCPYWPPEAQEWITHHRPHGWSSKGLIDQIVNEGCFLFGKSQPCCMGVDDTQWRHSFSKAEIRLISSWTDS